MIICYLINYKKGIINGAVNQAKGKSLHVTIQQRGASDVRRLCDVLPLKDAPASFQPYSRFGKVILLLV